MFLKLLFLVHKKILDHYCFTFISYNAAFIDLLIYEAI